MVPAGALSQQTAITVERASPADLPPGVDFPVDFLIPGTLFDFGPDGLSFAVPATLTLEYDASLLPPGTDESRLRLVRVDSAVETLFATDRDTLGNRISADVDHFTFFGLLLPRLVPQFPVQIDVEETIAVTDRIDQLRTVDPPRIDVVESIRVTDVPGVSAPGVVRVRVTEAIDVTDAPSTDAPGVVQVAVNEAITVSDAVNPQAPGVVRIDVTEGIGVADVVQPPDPTGVLVQVTEAVSVTDAVTVEAPGVVSIEVTEAIAVDDAPGTRLSGPVSVTLAEPITVTDAVELELQAVASEKVYVGSGNGTLGVFDTELSALPAIEMPGQVGSVARRPGSREVWVLERGSDSLVVVDAATDTRVAAAYSGTLDPIALDFDASGSTAVVADNNADRLVVFDAATLTPIGGSITDFGVPRPTEVQVSADGSTAWVVGNNVAKVDLVNGTPLDTAEVGGITFAADAALTPDESELWVLDGIVGAIVIYDAVSLAVLDTLSLSGGTTTGEEKLLVSEDGTTVYATTSTEGELVVFDAATRAEVGRFGTGGSASALAVDPDRNVAYLLTRAFDGEVVLFDLGSATVLDRIAFPSPRGLLLYR